MQSVKIVLLGDPDVGKSSLLISYTTNKFPNHIPTTGPNDYATHAIVGKQSYMLTLFDTLSQEEHGQLRPLSYPQTDVFLVCFSVVNPLSFASVKEKWVPEIMRYCQQKLFITPFLLVGTQSDLRHDRTSLNKLTESNVKPITSRQGEKLANELGAVKYVECSALTQDGIINLFDQAIYAAFNLEAPPVGLCQLL